MFYAFARDRNDFDGASDGVFVCEDGEGFCFPFSSFDGNGGKGRALWVWEFEVSGAGAAYAEVAKEFVL